MPTSYPAARRRKRSAFYGQAVEPDEREIIGVHARSTTKDERSPQPVGHLQRNGSVSAVVRVHEILGLPG
jgi:hypothetical protein